MVKCEWYSPVCDQLLAIFKYIYDNYDRGKPYATRLFIPVNDKVLEYENKVTIAVHKVAFKQLHAEHLMRILHGVASDKTVTKELENLPKFLKNGKMLKDGFREIELRLYRGYIRDIVEALESVKSGSYGLFQLDVTIGEDKEKSPFEL